MNVLVVSDIHGNLAALEAVLAAAPPHDAVWNLGDTVGYGPEPAACLTWTAASRITLAGNHDLAATGAASTEWFNPAAKAAAAWTRSRLTASECDQLNQYPSLQLTEHDVILAHGSPRDPVWEYVTDATGARAGMTEYGAWLTLVGHTHVPISTHLSGDGIPSIVRIPAGTEVDLSGPGRWLINPGSVGQPRDHDPRAAFGILDLGERRFTAHRVEYDVARTQRAMRQAGLPASLVDRLAFGR